MSWHRSAKPYERVALSSRKKPAVRGLVARNISSTVTPGKSAYGYRPLLFGVAISQQQHLHTFRHLSPSPTSFRRVVVPSLHLRYRPRLKRSVEKGHQVAVEQSLRAPSSLVSAEPLHTLQRTHILRCGPRHGGHRQLCTRIAIIASHLRGRYQRCNTRCPSPSAAGLRSVIAPTTLRSARSRTSRFFMPPSTTCGVCGHDVDPRKAFLVECHFCGRWLHGVCAQLSEQDALLVAKFACASCRTHGHDSVTYDNNGPFDADAMSFSPLPVHLDGYTAAVRHKKSASSFRRLLGAAVFARSGVHLVPSQDVQPHFLQQHALEEPVLIAGNSHRAAALDEPFPALDAASVAKLLAENRAVRATDVASQTRQELTADNWQTQCSQQGDEDAALLANAEFRLQQTPMQMQVAAPVAVAQVAWTSNGDDNSSGDADKFGVFLERNAYLDFALAPGGQCTWLSVSAGELWVYLIPPVNLDAFRDWKNGPDFATAFLVERVDKCIKCVVSAGSTLLVPAGWMYARFAGGVQCCSVFHGFFACTAAMEAQLGVVMLELQHEALAQYWNETTCGWMTVDANVQLWMAVCSYVRQLLMTNNGMNARVSEQDRRALNKALPRLREWSELPASLKSVNGITWTPSSLQEAQGIVGRLEQALAATYVPGHTLDDFHPTTGFTSGNKLPPISPNEATYIYSAASVPDAVSGSPWGSSSTGFDSNTTSNFSSSTPMWSSYDPIQHHQQQPDHLVVSTQNQPYLHSDPSLQQQQQSNQAFGGAEYGYMSASGTPLGGNPGYMGASDSQGNLGLEGLNSLGSLSSQSLELGATGTPLAPGHNFQQPRLDSNGNYVDMLMRHRASCHRCGNLRKKNVRCPVCPHIFCAKCAEKMIEEHGDRIFENGCPVCKELCCCGKNRTTRCTRKFHCYKKCPSTKRPAAG